MKTHYFMSTNNDSGDIIVSMKSERFTGRLMKLNAQDMKLHVYRTPGEMIDTNICKTLSQDVSYMHPLSTLSVATLNVNSPLPIKDKFGSYMANYNIDNARMGYESLMCVMNALTGWHGYGFGNITITDVKPKPHELIQTLNAGYSIRALLDSSWEMFDMRGNLIIRSDHVHNGQYVIKRKTVPNNDLQPYVVDAPIQAHENINGIVDDVIRENLDAVAPTRYISSQDSTKVRTDLLEKLTNGKSRGRFYHEHEEYIQYEAKRAPAWV